MENLFRDHLDYTRYKKQSQCVAKSKKRFHKKRNVFIKIKSKYRLFRQISECGFSVIL